MRKYIAFAIAIVFSYWWLTPKSISVPVNGADVKSVAYNYYEYIKGDASASSELPLIIALHGDGDTPKNFFDTMWSDELSQVRISAVRIIILKGPYAMNSSQWGGARWPWEPNEIKKYGDAISNAAVKLAMQYPSKGKPILVGFSGGACMAYYLAARHSDQFSTIIPLAGRLSAGIQIDVRFAGSSAIIHAMHGKSDAVIGFGEGQSAVERLAEAGLPATLEEVPGNHHAFYQEAHDRFFGVVQEAIDRL